MLNKFYKVDKTKSTFENLKTSNHYIENLDISQSREWHQTLNVLRKNYVAKVDRTMAVHKKMKPVNDWRRRDEKRRNRRRRRWFFLGGVGGVGGGIGGGSSLEELEKLEDLEEE